MIKAINFNKDNVVFWQIQMQLREKEVELDLYRSKMKSYCYTSSPSPLFVSSPFSVENLRMMTGSGERRLSTTSSPDDRHDRISFK